MLGFSASTSLAQSSHGSLAHQSQIDSYLQQDEAEFSALQKQSWNPLLYKNFRKVASRSRRRGSEKLRFQADADLNEDIVTGLLRGELGMGFQTAVVARYSWFTDEQVRERVSVEFSCLMSAKTASRLFVNFIEKRSSGGLAL